MDTRKKKQPKYSDEFRERAVRLVEEQQKDGKSQWAAMQSISAKLGCTAETLRRWVRRVERDRGRRPGVTTAEAEELKRLRRENKELKRANDILRTASAYFAQAELDRRQK
jgi:transposase-like protein